MELEYHYAIHYIRTPKGGWLDGMELPSRVKFPDLASAGRWMSDARTNLELSGFKLEVLATGKMLELAKED